MLLIVTPGCVAPIQHETASGKPEAVVASSDLDDIGSALTTRMLDSGFNLERQSTNLLVFTKESSNLGMSMLYGSKYDSTPAYRITYTLAQVATGTRVLADVAILTNPGSGFERATSLNKDKVSISYQTILDELASQYRSSTSPPPTAGGEPNLFDPYLAPK